MKPLVSIEELSRLIDGALTPADRADIESRLTQCKTSAAILARLKTLTQTVASNIIASPPPPADTPKSEECLGELVLAKLADGNLTPQEKAAAEAHLATCSRCLALVVENLRTASSMHRGRWPELPEDVKENRHISILINQREESPREDEENIIIDLAEDAQVCRTFASEYLTIDIRLTPAGAGRASLQMIIKESLSNKSGQEVIIAIRGANRKFFTGRTGKGGLLEIPRLPTGNYIAHFTGFPLKIEVVIT